MLRRLLEILRGKAGYAAGGMRRSATLQSMTTTERKPVDECADYCFITPRVSGMTTRWPRACHSPRALLKGLANTLSTTG